MIYIFSADVCQYATFDCSIPLPGPGLEEHHIPRLTYEQLCNYMTKLSLVI